MNRIVRRFPGRKELFRLKKTACMILTVLLAIFLVSCSRVNKSDFVGRYELSRAEGVGINLTQEQIDSMKVVGLTAILEINDDGTAKMDIFGEKLELTYDLRKMTFSCEGKEEKFTFEGDKVAFNNEGRKFEFTKIG